MLSLIKRYGLLLCLNGLTAIYGQSYNIHGIVRNSAFEPISFVDVSVLDNPSLNTQTDIRGAYSINISEGSYVLVFNLKGFQTFKIPITVNHSDVEQDIILEISATEIKGIKISSKKIDRSEEIIQHVIDGKYRFLFQDAYSVDAYIKATDKESSEKAKKDSSKFENNLNLAEVYLRVHFSPPNKIKEQRQGVEIRGEKSGLFFLTHTDGDFNFYKNLIEIPALSETPILSPISNSGLIAYKYRMLNIFTENGIRYFRIKISPSLMGNALVSGEIVIQDSIWCVRSLDLSLPKHYMTEYDVFEVKQRYDINDSNILLKRMEFVYEAKYGKTKASGRTVVYYSNYKLKAVYKRNFFNNELSSTAKEAYEKDSLYWNQLRQEPFTHEELVFLRHSDSLKALHSQKSWQDSTDKAYNKLSIRKLLLTGQGHYKRSAERLWEFIPLIFVYTPVYLAGPRFRYWAVYEKTNKNKKEHSLMPSISIGTLNKDIKGSISFFKLYNPFSRGSYNIGLGSDFGVINPYNSWLKGLSRSNFFVSDFVNAFHRIELFNGFSFGTGIEYANRKSISNLKFDKKGDDLWGGNTETTAFQGYQALFGSINIYYVPFQKYIREPYQKLILGSKWPELSVRYRKGLNVLGSVVDFDYLEFVAEHELKVGLFGISKYRVVSGEFLNTKDLRLIDNKFQRSIGPIFFANPLYSFQGIDTSYATVKRFYEAHYFHRFNGAIINKIPFLKKINISECVGGGLLYTTERNMQFIEAYVGIEKIIRLWKERIRIGVFYVANYNNLYSMKPELKFTIEIYDKIRNKWPY